MTAHVTTLGRFGIAAHRTEAALGATALTALASTPALHAPAALLFLAAGMALAAFRPVATIADLLSSRALFLLPAFCLLSTIWSLYPGLTFRHALQLTATFVIAVLIARCVPFRTAMAAIFLTLLVLVMVSVVAGPYRSDTGALVGLFGSKNEMAGMSALLTLTGFGMATLRDGWPPLRIVAALGAVVGLAAAILAQSLGALAYIGAGAGAFVAIVLLPRIGLSAQLTGLVLALMLAVLLGTAIAAEFAYFTSAFVHLTGKDITLTGRTELWLVALNLIAERPLLGTGYQAFWVHGHIPAEALWEAFAIESRSGFNFHNTYLSNAVEIGVIGVAIQSAIIGAALILSGLLALRTGGREAALLFGLAAFLTLMTLFEATVFFQFSLYSTLTVLIVVYAAAGLTTLRRR